MFVPVIARAVQQNFLFDPLLHMVIVIKTFYIKSLYVIIILFSFFWIIWDQVKDFYFCSKCFIISPKNKDPLLHNHNRKDKL